MCQIPIMVNALETKEINKITSLQKRIAKNYSGKFCNGIGIGISKEGAARLAISENKEAKFNPSLWFELASSGKENLKKINQDELDEQISKRIVDDCGGAIGLSGQKGVNTFKEYLINIRNDMLD